MKQATQAPAHDFSAGIIWLKVAILYLIVGVGMGIAMGMTRNFTLRPVHAHLNLLGWTTLALAGLIYSAFPQAGRSMLAKAHFWMMNLAVPVMMTSLGFILSGNMAWLPALVVSEIVAALAILVFAANLFINLKAPNPAEAAESTEATRPAVSFT